MKFEEYHLLLLKGAFLVGIFGGSSSNRNRLGVGHLVLSGFRLGNKAFVCPITSEVV